MWGLALLAGSVVVVRAPLAVSLPGFFAGAVGVALGDAAVVVRAEALRLGGGELRVEVAGGAAGTAAGRAAELAALGVLEAVGEEAVVRLVVEPVGITGPLSPVPAAAAGAAAAVSGLLGVEPAPMELAGVVNRAVAEALGAPMAPLSAASLLGGAAAGSEQPPLYARVPGEVPGWSVYAVEAPPLEEPEREVAVTLPVYRQAAGGLAAALLHAASGGWEGRLRGFLAAESPWDRAAAEAVRRAREAALGRGAVAAGLDPYQPVLVVIGSMEAAEAASAILREALGREPAVVGSRVAASGALGEALPGGGEEGEAG